MDPIMSMFIELVRELSEHGNISRLEFLKHQLETERDAIGEETRIMEKLRIVNEAIDKLNTEDNR